MNVTFNPQNTQQVSQHLKRIIKTNSQLQAAISELNQAYYHAMGNFSDIVEVHKDGSMSVPYYDKHGDKAGNNSDWLNIGPSLGEMIAFAMKDYDAPFSKREVMDFCTFFEINPKEMLEAALSDEQYQQYLDNQRHSSFWARD